MSNSPAISHSKREDATRYPLEGRGLQQVENLFSYHAPHGDQAERYAMLRDEAKRLAVLACNLCPESAERTLGIRALHNAVMHFNSAIACNERLGAPKQQEPPAA